MRRALVVLLLAVVALPAGAAVSEQRYRGYARDAVSGRYLYAEEHSQRYDGSRWLGGTIRYVDPAGRVLGEKTLDFSRDRYVPLMRYSLLAPSHGEAITAVGPDGLTLERSDDGRHETVTLPRQAGMAADSGFNAWLVDHLDELAAGKVLSLNFVVVGRLDAYRFRVRRTGDVQREGERAVALVVEPDSLLRYLVDPLRVVYGLTSRRLLQYQGLSNLVNPATGKPWQVEIVYPSQAPRWAGGN